MQLRVDIVQFGLKLCMNCAIVTGGCTIEGIN